jgi:KUP system potassium uptake protein
MEIDYKENGTAGISMVEHLQEGIAMFGEPIGKSATSPARRGLFHVDETSEVLSKERKETFHSVVAKYLFVSMRARLDIELPIAFLCTRVTKSTKQDWDKLKRVLEFINGTINDERVIGADDIGRMTTWVDASHAVHQDMRSHTGGAVSFGTGAIMSKSSKQKINTKSSTESELVGASDYLPYPIWAKKFLEGQGYYLKENKYMQDNVSCIRFEENGMKSGGPNSRHIDARYFFIKDRLDMEDIDVVYCPTEEMLADFFTKPLQGKLFRRLRAVVMGHQHIDTLKLHAPTESQERVGESEKREVCETTGDASKAVVTATKVSAPQKRPGAPAMAVGQDIRKLTWKVPEASYADTVRKNLLVTPITRIGTIDNDKSVRRGKLTPLTLKK